MMLNMKTRGQNGNQKKINKNKPNEGKYYPRYEVYIRLNKVEEFGKIKEAIEND